MECPLVQLAKHRQIEKKFVESGLVAIPMNEWLRFFESLAFIYRAGGGIEIYCTIAGGFLVFSRKPIKRRVDLRPEQIERFDW